MNRHVFAPAIALLFATFTATTVFAQAQKVAPQPATRAKFVRPVKGMAYIQMLQPAKTKRVGKDVVTVVTIKNMSNGAIHLLKVDEYWYDKSRKNIVTASMASVRKPINPGDIVEITLTSPWNAAMNVNQYFFSHANGKIDVKAVKKFD
jgi:flagellar basal body L-ring protein FlgH